jgi:opacity protein-like surface antigen
MKVCSVYPITTALALVASAPATLAGSDQPAAVSAAAPPQKPVWVTDLSLGLKESYDDNVYFSDNGSLADRASWVTTVSPKLGVNLAPLLGDQKTVQALALGYAPDFVFYHDEPTENYSAHRLAQTIKAQSGDFSLNMDNGFNYIDGSDVGPTYSLGRSAYATGVARERREQIQDRNKFSLQYDQDKWFVRPTASLLYYDLMTDLRSTPGYDNYADRYDVNGGLDLGYKLEPQLAVTLGYRYGHQYQQQFPLAIDKEMLSSSSDYQRVLLGLEGNPWKWLTLSVQGGPDFRAYEPDSATHTTPVSDKNPIKYYGEASLAAALTSKDTLTFKYKQWQWVSSTGKLPYFDSLYELSYRRKLTSQLSLDLTGRIQSSDYTSADIATGQRDDWQYTLSAGLSYAFTANLSASLAYTANLGRNAQDGLTEAAADPREYNEQLVSLGLLYKF